MYGAAGKSYFQTKLMYRALMFFIALGHIDANGVNVENGVRLCCGHIRMSGVLDGNPPGHASFMQLERQHIMTFKLFLSTG